MSRHTHTTSSILLTLVAGVLAFCASAAQAALYKVGADGACDYSTIAEAVAAAEANSSDPVDGIHIASNQDYTQQAITIYANSKAIEITGGFADCSQTASTGRTIIRGGNINGGGATNSVFRITANSFSAVRLDSLTIQGGNAAGSNKGGGIYFKGSPNGTLELDHCTVTQNTAGYGGGIYVEGVGTGNAGILMVGEDVDIVGNTARFDGGGIVIDGASLVMNQPDSYIANNHAPNGYGGGLLVLAAREYSVAYVGSSGFGNAGTIIDEVPNGNVVGGDPGRFLGFSVR